MWLSIGILITTFLVLDTVLFYKIPDDVVKILPAMIPGGGIYSYIRYRLTRC